MGGAALQRIIRSSSSFVESSMPSAGLSFAVACHLRGSMARGHGRDEVATEAEGQDHGSTTRASVAISIFSEATYCNDASALACYVTTEQVHRGVASVHHFQWGRAAVEAFHGGCGPPWPRCVWVLMFLQLFPAGFLQTKQRAHATWRNLQLLQRARDLQQEDMVRSIQTGASSFDFATSPCLAVEVQNLWSIVSQRTSTCIHRRMSSRPSAA